MPILGERAVVASEAATEDQVGLTACQRDVEQALQLGSFAQQLLILPLQLTGVAGPHDLGGALTDRFIEVVGDGDIGVGGDQGFGALRLAAGVGDDDDREPP